MSLAKFEALLATKLGELEKSGRRKGEETVIAGIIPAADGLGPRFLLKDHGDRPFLRRRSISWTVRKVTSCLDACAP